MRAPHGPGLLDTGCRHLDGTHTGVDAVNGGHDLAVVPRWPLQKAQLVARAWGKIPQHNAALVVGISIAPDLRQQPPGKPAEAKAVLLCSASMPCAQLA